MTNAFSIVPVEGRLVRDPATGKPVTTPITVSLDEPFWRRRLGDGDVEIQPAKEKTR